MTSSEALAADPAAAAGDALGYLPPGPLAVHIDVDVLDFTDAPLAENTDGRNTGPTLDQAGEALRVAARDPRLRSLLSIGELDPTPQRRRSGGGSPLRRRPRRRPGGRGVLMPPGLGGPIQAEFQRAVEVV